MITFFKHLDISYYNNLINKENKEKREIQELVSTYITSNPGKFRLEIGTEVDKDSYYSLERYVNETTYLNAIHFMPKILKGICVFNYYEGEPDGDIIEYTQYFLNDLCMNNLFTYMKYKGLDSLFLNRLDSIKSKFDTRNIIIVSGAVINAYGFRDSADIDAKIKVESNERKVDNKGLGWFSPKVFYKESRQKELMDTVPSFLSQFEDILYDSRCHFYLKGIKFLSLEIETKMKSYRMTPKGYADVYYYWYIFKHGPRVAELSKTGKIKGQVGPHKVEWPNRFIFINVMKKKLEEWYHLSVSIEEINRFIYAEKFYI